jgi:acid phosphatase class B
MRKIAFLFISILAIAFVIASPAMAQEPEPPFQEKGVLPDTLLQDPELGSLWKNTLACLILTRFR